MVSSCPIACCLGEDPKPHLATISFLVSLLTAPRDRHSPGTWLLNIQQTMLHLSSLQTKQWFYSIKIYVPFSGMPLAKLTSVGNLTLTCGHFHLHKFRHSLENAERINHSLHTRLYNNAFLSDMLLPYDQKPLTLQQITGFRGTHPKSESLRAVYTNQTPISHTLLL